MKKWHSGLVVLTVMLVAAGTNVFAAEKLQDGMQDLADQIVFGMKDVETDRIAIMEFVNLDGTMSNLGRYLSERLITEMYRTGTFEVVERRLLQKILDELELNQSDLIDAQSAQRIGKTLGVGAILIGSITDLGDYVEINGRLIETETGRIFGVAATEIVKDSSVSLLMNGGGITEGPAAVAAEEVLSLPAKPIAKTGKCPEGMVFIPAGKVISTLGKAQIDAFCIDKYEYPNYKGLMPKVSINWKDSYTACANEGKRLPTEAEWVRALAGDDPTKISMGCSDKVQAAGSNPNCVSTFGVSDIGGNVFEWVHDCSNSGFTWSGNNPIAPEKEGCYRIYRNSISARYDTNDSYRDSKRGFRCAQSIE